MTLNVLVITGGRRYIKTTLCFTFANFYVQIYSGQTSYKIYNCHIEETVVRALSSLEYIPSKSLTTAISIKKLTPSLSTEDIGKYNIDIYFLLIKTIPDRNFPTHKNKK